MRKLEVAVDGAGTSRHSDDAACSASGDADVEADSNPCDDVTDSVLLRPLSIDIETPFATAMAKHSDLATCRSSSRVVVDASNHRATGTSTCGGADGDIDALHRAGSAAGTESSTPLLMLGDGDGDGDGDASVSRASDSFTGCDRDTPGGARASWLAGTAVGSPFSVKNDLSEINSSPEPLCV
jgi:hypothetical protein